jgi:hypothetical protein
MNPSNRSSLAAVILVLSSPVAVNANTDADAGTAGDSASPRGPTRAEVRADLKAWESAGLRQLYRGDGGPQFFDPNLQRRLAEYQRLRATAPPQGSR